MTAPVPDRMPSENGELHLPSHTWDLEEKRRLVERVSNSQTFQRSPRLREFFLYAADCTLANRIEDARELQIALNVFHRKPDYNPGQDNIVRVEARLLRKRLESYFAAEGLDSPLLITMPKGSYTLSFSTRPEVIGDFSDSSIEKALNVRQGADPATARVSELSTLSLAQALEQEGNPETIGPAALQSSLRKTRRGLRLPHWLPFTMFGIVATLMVFGLLWRNRPMGNSDRLLPLSAVFDGKKAVDIVTSDATLITIKELANREVSLQEYMTRHYPPAADPVNQDLIRHLEGREYTDSNEVGLAGKILLRYGRLAPEVFVRSARDMGLALLKERNVILVGSPIANPWGELYYDDLPFQFDSTQRGVVINKQPRAGEQPKYVTTTRSGETGDAHALLALVPNLGSGGYTLLIAGTTAEATAAAGEFVLNEAQIEQAYKTMGIKRGGPPRYFELLLKARTFPGSATQTAVQAWRLLDFPSHAG